MNRQQSIAQVIHGIVKQFDISGQRMSRPTEYRPGGNGFGYYTVIDHAYWKTTVLFFRDVAEAAAWASDRREQYGYPPPNQADALIAGFTWALTVGEAGDDWAVAEAAQTWATSRGLSGVAWLDLTTAFEDAAAVAVLMSQRPDPQDTEARA